MTDIHHFVNLKIYFVSMDSMLFQNLNKVEIVKSY